VRGEVRIYSDVTSELLRKLADKIDEGRARAEAQVFVDEHVHHDTDWYGRVNHRVERQLGDEVWTITVKTIERIQRPCSRCGEFVDNGYHPNHVCPRAPSETWPDR
jgi:hypothetical protein